MPERLVSVDIGSTYTKGALFERTPGGLAFRRRVVTPTTQEDLSQGFFKVLKELTGLGPGALGLEAKEDLTPSDKGRGETGPGDVRVRFSSSAKGGLRIAAVGLVPDLTLQIARLAAWSAGGKIVADSSFKLGEETLERILGVDPDIILFTGGTDGGNEETVLWNARQLASTSYKGTILYAGNRVIQKEVQRILEGKRLVIAPNVMPRVGEIRIEETRNAIQRIFLDTIVLGKGLSPVREFCGTEPIPTPAAVFDLVEAMGTHLEGWDRFCVIDLGGATTDVYSVGEAYWGEEGVILRGLREPRVKRTVEGDLGIRVSARALWDTLKPFYSPFADWLWDRGAAGAGLAGEKLASPAPATEGSPTEGEMESYVDKVNQNTAYLPSSERERRIDRMLALAAVGIAILRHAGYLEETYTPAGKIFLQSGKDLRPVSAVVGSGGYLSLFDLGNPVRSLFQRIAQGGLSQQGGGGIGLSGSGRGSMAQIPLVPKSPAYFRDASYLFPLLGNFAKEYPREVATLAAQTLQREDNP